MINKTYMNSIRMAALAIVAAIPGLSCTYSVSVPAIPASGGIVYVSVYTQPGCAWQVNHTGSFLSNYSGVTGSTSATVMLYAQPDRAGTRTATVNVMQPYQTGCQQIGTRNCIPAYSYRVAASATAVQY